MIHSIFRMIVCFVIFSSVALADITSHLEGYTQLDCPLKPLNSLRKRASSHKPNRPSKHHPQPKETVLNSIQQAFSTNWSGYAAATNLAAKTGKVNAVSGSWVVPKITSTPKTTYSAFWVGIDGYSSNSVEQIGTEHDWIAGRQQNFAWFEMFPLASMGISKFPLQVGDVIEGEVEFVGVVNGRQQFKLSLVNHTHKSFFTKTLSPPKSAGVVGRASAEWIAEAPAIANKIVPLADFQKEVFTNCVVTINGIKGGIQNAKWQTAEITMVGVNQPSTIKAAPSSLAANQQSFSVTWENSGP